MNHLLESIVTGFGRRAGENLWRFFRQFVASPEPGEASDEVNDNRGDGDEHDDSGGDLGRAGTTTG